MQKLNLKNRRGQNIVGILTRPEPEILGTVVLQHGYGSTKEARLISAVGKSFLSLGFQVFNFDSPNSFGESSGSYEEARLGLHADDFEDVANWAQVQEWFTGKLLVSGHSMGGFASIRYALRNADKVGYVISFALVVSGESWMESIKKNQPDRLKEWIEKGEYVRESKSVPGRQMISPYEMILEAQNHSLFKERKLIPDLLLFGFGLDTSCPVKNIELFFNQVTGLKQLEVIPESIHSPKDSQIITKITAKMESWIKKRKTN